MRILFIFHMPSIKGGASKSGLTLVKGLKERGHQVLAFCPGEDTLSRTLRSEGIEVATFDYDWAFPYFEQSPKGYVKYLPKVFYYSLRNKRALNSMTEVAKSFRPDIIHTNSGVADIGLKLARRLGTPHISHFREFGWQDCNAVMLHEPSMRKYPLQYGIAIGKEILNWHTKPGDRNTLIYNGIVRAGSARLSTEKEPWFLYVGGLFKKKGIEDLLEAYAALSSELRQGLKIAGSAVNDVYMKSLTEMTERLGIADSVEWLGERADVNDLMYKARALVVPSHHEAFGRIVVEGMINGCLVIGRDTDGIKEQFDNGLSLTGEEIGLRFDSTVQLTERLQQVATEEVTSFIPMIKRGMTSAENLYSVEGYIDRVGSLYENIIKQQK